MTDTETVTITQPCDRCGAPVKVHAVSFSECICDRCWERHCPLAPGDFFYHQVDTSMEAGPSNCFFCGEKMP